MIYITPEYFKDYLKNKGLRDKTIQGYIFCLYEYGNFIFNQEGTNRFLSMREGKHNNPTGRSFLKNIQECLLVNANFLKIPEHDFRDISQVRIPKYTGAKAQRIVRPLTIQQIQLLESYLETPQTRLMLNVSYYCGLRLQELLGIKLRSFNWTQWKMNPTKSGEVIVYGKRDKEGIAVVPAWLMEKIAVYVNENLKMFSNVDSFLFQVSPRTWQNYLMNAGIKSGITLLDEQGKPIKNTIVHPHRLRHSYATSLLQKGVDIKFIKEALRHSNISSTDVYMHIDKEELKRELERVNATTNN